MTDEEKLLKIEELRVKFENGVIEWLGLGDVEFEITLHLFSPFGKTRKHYWLDVAKNMEQFEINNLENAKLQTPNTYGDFTIFK